MTDFLRLIGEWLQYLWPFRRVCLFEKGLYTICGRWQWLVGPGVWPIIPWFCEVDTESVVKGVVETQRLDITLSDGVLLSCMASGVVQVSDLRLAVNNVDAYMESAQELFAAIVADKLAEVDASRLSYEKRSRLLSDLKRWVNQEAGEFGIEFTRLRFTTFVLNPRTYRLLSDGATGAAW